MRQKIRQPSVAGQFYAGDKQLLKAEIDEYLNDVSDPGLHPKQVFGLISPHAGYPCSAPTAAYGYRLLQRFTFKRAVVIAPSHSDYFDGLSVYDGDGYATPLGIVPVDRALCDQLTAAGLLVRSSEVGHLREHALEVQLPFLQIIYPAGIDLIPVTVGVTAAGELQEFAELLAQLLNPADTVIIASSDLSHYYPEAFAHQRDRHLTDLLEKFDLAALATGFDDQSLEACGLGPILILMYYAYKLGAAQCRILDYRTSGDTCGDKLQVVGYTSAVVYR
ncbi:MAG TPA: AmmeMemoRadiSam system protein B [Candidatus Marinimicrobia bacterium]|nr:AmmeMemoRadiSam system protein B [Candidatus Neomarinimicrobiota bacterium]